MERRGVFIRSIRSQYFGHFYIMCPIVRTSYNNESNMFSNPCPSAVSRLAREDQNLLMNKPDHVFGYSYEVAIHIRGIQCVQYILVCSTVKALHHIHSLQIVHPEYTLKSGTCILKNTRYDIILPALQCHLPSRFRQLINYRYHTLSYHR